MQLLRRVVVSGQATTLPRDQVVGSVQPTNTFAGSAHGTTRFFFLEVAWPFPVSVGIAGIGDSYHRIAIICRYFVPIDDEILVIRGKVIGKENDSAINHWPAVPSRFLTRRDRQGIDFTLNPLRPLKPVVDSISRSWKPLLPPNDGFRLIVVSLEIQWMNRGESCEKQKPGR
jgi:hypothetical protein